MEVLISLRLGAYHYYDKIMIIVRDITERKTEELLNKSDTLAAIGQLAAA